MILTSIDPILENLFIQLLKLINNYKLQIPLQYLQVLWLYLQVLHNSQYTCRYRCIYFCKYPTWNTYLPLYFPKIWICRFFTNIEPACLLELRSGKFKYWEIQWKICMYFKSWILKMIIHLYHIFQVLVQYLQVLSQYFCIPYNFINPKDLANLRKTQRIILFLQL